MTSEADYKFVVVTNKYAGNFERAMCAFMTGHIGDCGVGRKESEEFLELLLIGKEYMAF